MELTAEYWEPIVRHVSERSGVPLKLKIGRTAADATAYVLTREVDLAFTNHLFSPDRDQLGWRVLARRDAPAVSGQIVVLSTSTVTNLAELAGKGVAFSSSESLIGYKLPYAHLLSRGIKARAVFTGNLDGALAQLVAGKVDALGVNSGALDGLAQRARVNLRVLWKSEPMHDLAVMASNRVSPDDARALTAAFIGMRADPKGREILAKASRAVGLPPETGFVASDGAEYAAYRHFYLTAPAALR
jgi:phosphonate transport system substrate-binding protein